MKLKKALKFLFLFSVLLLSLACEYKENTPDPNVIGIPTKTPTKEDADINNDNSIDDKDIKLITEKILESIYDKEFDLNGDGNVNDIDKSLLESFEEAEKTKVSKPTIAVSLGSEGKTITINIIKGSFDLLESNEYNYGIASCTDSACATTSWVSNMQKLAFNSGKTINIDLSGKYKIYVYATIKDEKNNDAIKTDNTGPSGKYYVFGPYTFVGASIEKKCSVEHCKVDTNKCETSSTNMKIGSTYAPKLNNYAGYITPKQKIIPVDDTECKIIYKYYKEDNSNQTTNDEKSDTTQPSLSNFKMKTTTGKTSANANDIISLTFTASEELEANPYVYFNKSKAAAQITKNGNTYTATIAASKLDEGEVYFAVGGYKDKAGNSGKTITSGTPLANSSTHLTIDKTPPTCIITVSNNYIYSKSKDNIDTDLNISWKINDGTKKITQKQLQYNGYDKYTLTVVDDAGNESTCYKEKEKIDTYN